MAKQFVVRLLVFATVGVIGGIVSGVDGSNGPFVIALLAGITLALYWNAKRSEARR